MLSNEFSCLKKNSITISANRQTKITFEKFEVIKLFHCFEWMNNKILRKWRKWLPLDSLRRRILGNDARVHIQSQPHVSIKTDNTRETMV